MALKKSEKKWSGLGVSREELHAGKRRALIRAAAKVFREKGVQEASMDDIAAELNVSKAAIYYYVKDKKELVFSCHQAAFDIGEEAASEAEAQATTAAQRLEILIRTYTIKLTGELGGGALMTSDSVMTPEQLNIIRKRREAWDQMFRDFVSQAMMDGAFRDVDPRLTEFFVMGAIRSLHRWYSPVGEKTGEEVAEELVSLIFDGLRVR